MPAQLQRCICRAESPSVHPVVFQLSDRERTQSPLGETYTSALDRAAESGSTETGECDGAGVSTVTRRSSDRHHQVLEGSRSVVLTAHRVAAREGPAAPILPAETSL